MTSSVPEIVKACVRQFQRNPASQSKGIFKGRVYFYAKIENERITGLQCKKLNFIQVHWQKILHFFGRSKNTNIHYIAKLLAEADKENPFNELNETDSELKNFLEVIEGRLKRSGTSKDDPIQKIFSRHLSKPDESTRLNTLTSKLLTAYESDEEGWALVSPETLRDMEKPFPIMSGSASAPGLGRWKIHLSIDPAKMREAIPILIDVLLGPDAPRLGFKMQNRKNLESSHQIGKELAIIFGEDVENAALAGNLSSVQQCLSTLAARLQAAGITPEDGYVLTPETQEAIERAPAGTQELEKRNLLSGKFDRAIPSSSGVLYFFYRNSEMTLLQDDAIGDMRGLPGIVAASEALKLAKEEPLFAHNPIRDPDPFINLSL